MTTLAEENYLKSIFKIAEKDQKAASTTAISKQMNTSAASVTDMLKKLADKELVHYEKYRGVYLTSEGNKVATQLIRKHRLWEVFLVDKLKFRWDQVHHIAEELEHIDSNELIRRLDIYLGKPKFDPHGDPIPNAEGKFTIRTQVSLFDMPEGSSGVLLGVKTHETPFLEYLNSLNIGLGTTLHLIKKTQFDNTIKVRIGETATHVFTESTSQLLLMKKI